MSRPFDDLTDSSQDRATATNSVTVSGGTFAGSVIGAGNVTVGQIGGSNQATVADLRTRLTVLRPLLVEAGRTPNHRDKIAYELHELLASLSADKPDAAPVKTRWSAIQRFLGGAAAAGTAVTAAVKEISELVNALFG